MSEKPHKEVRVQSAPLEGRRTVVRTASIGPTRRPLTTESSFDRMAFWPEAFTPTPLAHTPGGKAWTQLGYTERKKSLVRTKPPPRAGLLSANGGDSPIIARQRFSTNGHFVRSGALFPGDERQEYPLIPTLKTSSRPSTATGAGPTTTQSSGGGLRLDSILPSPVSLKSARAMPPRKRLVVSSWSPGNSQLHWHADFTNQDLEQLPDWLWNRRNLRVLHIRRNKLKNVPAEIGLLENLNELLADHNELRKLPSQLCQLTQLQKMDISHNQLTTVDGNLSTLIELRELRLDHNELRCLPESLSTGHTWVHLRFLDLSFNHIESLPNQIEHLEGLEVLNASYNVLEHVPTHIRCLEFLKVLDVSYNRLTELPISDLVQLFGKENPCLESVECVGNPGLLRPPAEIAEQGGHVVACYLKGVAGGDNDMPNHELVLVVIGEDKAGKSSMIKALRSADNTALRKGQRGRRKSVVVRGVEQGFEFSMWSPDDDLSFQILDIPGVYVYNTTHILFLMRRAVYIFVWSIRDTEETGVLPEWEILELERMVHSWIDSLHHRVPGASLAIVATHLEMASSPEDVEMQCELVRNAVNHRLEWHKNNARKTHGEDPSIYIRVLNDGWSLRIDSLTGEGVSELREKLVDFAKQAKWYGEPIPASYLRLRDRVLRMVRQGHRDWLTWTEYQKEADECGVNRNNHLRIATVFLHDMGIIRYFGDVDEAREATQKKLSSDAMLDTVFINLSWMVEVVQGLMKADRNQLMEFFSKGEFASKVMSFRLRRLLMHGFLHPTLLPFLWPQVESWPDVSSDMLQRYWEEVVQTTNLTVRGLGSGYHLVKTEDSLWRAVRLLEGLDIIAASNKGQQAESGASFVVPGLLATSHQFRVDSRVFGDDCLFKCTYDFSSLPPGFFERFIVRMRRHATHMDFNAYSAAFYRMGTKLQVFVNRDKDNQNAATGLTALFSSTKLWPKFKAELNAISKFFPGMQITHFEFSVASTRSSRRELLQKIRRSSSRYLKLIELARDMKKNAAAIIEDRVRDFEHRLTMAHDPVQVIISHSPVAGEFAQQLAQSLRMLDRELMVEVLSPGQISASKDEGIGGRVMLVCVDDEYAKCKECLLHFRAHVQSGQMVIPLILPGYAIKDFSRWWPSNMAEMGQYSLFIDIRSDEWLEMTWKQKVKQYYASHPDQVRQLRKLAAAGDLWASNELSLAEGKIQEGEAMKREKTCLIIHNDIKKILEEWRGDAPHGHTQLAKRIPCITCVQNIINPPAYFDHSECVKAMDTWRDDVLEARGIGDNAPPPPKKRCSNGHTQTVEAILSNRVVHDSVVCPSCWEHGNNPPWCFSRQQLLAFFDEDNTQRLGVMTCPKCSAMGLPALRILDILVPEVFLSYNWGVPVHDAEDAATVKYSTQEIVRGFRQHIEVHADVLCWLDVEGGLTAGQDHLKQIEEGVARASVTVIFISDQYVNSENCKREFFYTTHGGNFIIPVLVPEHRGPNGQVMASGWSGPGGENSEWWEHAVRKCINPAFDDNKLDWEVLSEFTPVDLRALSPVEAMEEVVKQIVTRFHRVNQYRLQVSRGKKRWNKLRLIHTFSTMPTKQKSLGSLLEQVSKQGAGTKSSTKKRDKNAAAGSAGQSPVSSPFRGEKDYAERPSSTTAAFAPTASVPQTSSDPASSPRIHRDRKARSEDFSSMLPDGVPGPGPQRSLEFLASAKKKRPQGGGVSFENSM